MIRAWITKTGHTPNARDIEVLQVVFEHKLSITVMSDGRTAIYAEDYGTAFRFWFYMHWFAPEVRPVLLHPEQL